MIEVKRILD
ncbi:Protein of unknown function [Lactobacillus delbrueckii subsp. lactis]|nr:Protein of unknown function [Lactobacillus delbrueckii subsp. lactis]